MLPLRAAVFIACVLPAAGGPLAAPAGPVRAACVLELSGRDAAGNTVLQTVAYALDRPGLVLAPLSAAARLRPRWERLQTAPDPALAGTAGDRAPFEVTEVLLEDPGRDLLLLRAPGLEACDAGRDPAAADLPGAGPGAPPVPSDGEPLIGIRDRDGYRSRIFQARLDRTFAAGAGPGVIRIRIPDGGGAGSGFLLDRHHRLVGSILPPPPGGDRLFACVVTIDRREIDAAASGTGRPVPGALLQASPGSFARTPARLLAQALLLTRDDQADQALRLLDEAVRLAGESDLLMMERGALRFRIGRNDAAIEDFARALRLNPRLHLAAYDLGVALGTAGRYTQSVEALARAVEIDPRHARTRYQLALALAASGRSDAARAECDRLEPIDPALARDLRAALAY